MKKTPNEGQQPWEKSAIAPPWNVRRDHWRRAGETVLAFRGYVIEEEMNLHSMVLESSENMIHM